MQRVYNIYFKIFCIYGGLQNGVSENLGGKVI